MDDSRIQRRTRVRPYDLRRKVLLKNFLQYQMTYVPPSRTESFPKSGSSPEESSSSDEDLPEIDEQVSSSDSPATVSNVFSVSSSSNDNSSKNNIRDEIDLSEEIDVVTIDPNVDIALDPIDISLSPGLVRFTGFFKRGFKTSSNGIFKNKKFCKNAKSSMKSRSFKKNFEKVFNGYKRSRDKLLSSQMTKNSPRSLFSMFKHRREQRHAKQNDKTKRHSNTYIPNNVPIRSSSMSQSVQTEGSWNKEEIHRVHESNKRLKEENKLLSESLSYFMSNSSRDPQVRQCNSPFESSNAYRNSLMFHDYTFSPSSSSQGNWNTRSRVFRSKSVHEFNERQKMLRNNYRTKSMSVHNSRNYFLSNSRPLLSTYNDVGNIPRFRKKSNITNIPNNSSSRNIQRRSSMPERPFSENDRYATYGRSNSMRNSYNRKPFYALPADAFY